MTLRPALFLDIDGVLYTGRAMHSRRFDPEALAALDWLIVTARPLIVLSSTWRTFRPADLRARLESCGLPFRIRHRTPDLSRRDDASGLWQPATRGDGIRAWLATDAAKRQGPKRRAVAIDDEVIDFAPLVLADFETGLTQALAERAASLLAAGA
jgi:hypothetical protein